MPEEHALLIWEYGKAPRKRITTQVERAKRVRDTEREREQYQQNLEKIADLHTSSRKNKSCEGQSQQVPLRSLKQIFTGDLQEWRGEEEGRGEQQS